MQGFLPLISSHTRLSFSRKDTHNLLFFRTFCPQKSAQFFLLLFPVSRWDVHTVNRSLLSCGSQSEEEERLTSACVSPCLLCLLLPLPQVPLTMSPCLAVPAFCPGLFSPPPALVLLVRLILRLPFDDSHTLTLTCNCFPSLSSASSSSPLLLPVVPLFHREISQTEHQNSSRSGSYSLIDESMEGESGQAHTYTGEGEGMKLMHRHTGPLSAGLPGLTFFPRKEREKGKERQDLPDRESDTWTRCVCEYVRRGSGWRIRGGRRRE